MNDNMKEVHAAAKVLLSTIEKFLGEKCMVSFGVIDKTDNTVGTSATFSDALDLDALRAITFQLNGRYYNMTDLNQE